jgi:hypothetical protein
VTANAVLAIINEKSASATSSGERDLAEIKAGGSESAIQFSIQDRKHDLAKSGCGRTRLVQLGIQQSFMGSHVIAPPHWQKLRPTR